MNQTNLPANGAGGKVCLVTGGSSGIGMKLAEHYAAEGYRVMIVARGLDRLKQVSSSIPGSYYIQADLSSKRRELIPRASPLGQRSRASMPPRLPRSFKVVGTRVRPGPVLRPHLMMQSQPYFAVSPHFVRGAVPSLSNGTSTSKYPWH